MQHILIVGGGIAGLSLAAGLQRAGFEPEIIERAPEFGAVGAGIVLGVNAMAMLGRLGLAERARDAGRQLDHAFIADAQGRALGRTDFRALVPRFGPTVAIHRADLHRVLLDSCGDVPLRAGTQIASLRERDDKVAVTTSDGVERDYDLVVGADGVNSSTRELVFGPNRPRYAGYTCWRMVVPGPRDLAGVTEMWGRGVRFGIVPLPGELTYCFAVANAPEGRQDPEFGRVERVRARFAELGGHVPELLDRLERPDQLIHNDLADLEQAPWYRGRVVLTGDAAHAVTPNMGQGAAMALESSAVLTEVLAERSGLTSSLARWQARRFDRVAFVRKQSRRIGSIGHWQNAIACRLRDFALRVTPDRVAGAALERLAAAEI